MYNTNAIKNITLVKTEFGRLNNNGDTNPIIGKNSS
jgi:hypothetical protein